MRALATWRATSPRPRVQDLAMSAQKGRDAVRPPQTHLETRSAAITRPKRRPRRIPPRRHRPKPPQARHADPNANADLSNLRRRAAHEHGRDRRSPPPQYFKTDFFNGIAPFRTFSVGRCKQPSCWKPAIRPTISETELSRHTGCSPSDREADHEAARVDAPAGRRGDQLAPRPTRAAEGDAGDRLPRHDLPRPGFIDFGRVPPGTQ